MVSKKIEKLAQVIWDYHHLNHQLEKADVIIVLGSTDLSVAERAVEIFNEGWASLVVVTGGYGRISRKKWNKPEAEILADILMKLGISREKIIIENKSTNTGENAVLAKRVLEEKGVKIKKAILVHKPYGERRAYATFKKNWPGLKPIVTSSQVAFENYYRKGISRNEIISIIVGDLQRIKEYPKKGFQIPQKIPSDVWAAYEELVRLGFAKHLIKDE